MTAVIIMGWPPNWLTILVTYSVLQAKPGGSSFGTGIVLTDVEETTYMHSQ